MIAIPFTFILAYPMSLHSLSYGPHPIHGGALHGRAAHCVAVAGVRLTHSIGG